MFYAPTLLTFPSRPKYDPLHHSCSRAVPYSKTGIPVSPSNHNPSLWHQFCGIKHRSQYCSYSYATFCVSRRSTSIDWQFLNKWKACRSKLRDLKQVLIANHTLHVARLCAGWSGVRIMAGARVSSRLHNIQPIFGARPTSYSMDNRGSFPVGKAAGAWGWPLTSIYCRG